MVILEKLSSSRPLLLLLLLSGAGIIALMIIQPPHEKIAIVGSTFGLLLFLIAVYFLDDRECSLVPTLTRQWLRYVPLTIGISVNIFASWAPPPITAFALAGAIALLFPLSRLVNISKVYVASLTVFLAGSAAYNVFSHYPPVNGIDPWRYLSVASAIMRGGHYSNVEQPTDMYYFAFPVMSIASSILSSVAGLDLRFSILLFPGFLILLQPLLVFLLSRIVFHDNKVAALSAFIVVTEAEVTRWMNAPIAQSAAISLLLLLLIVLFRQARSRGNVVVALVVFLMLVALHGAVGFVSVILVSYLIMREGSLYKGMISPLVAILLGYWMITAAIDRMIRGAEVNLTYILEFIFTPTLRTGGELYGAGSNGLIFVWWGMPVSLALLSILVQRRKRVSTWAYAGLGLLGLSFGVSVMVPNLDVDRYGGLAAWLFLAVAGGKALSTLSRSSRKLLMLIPIMFLVCLSAVANPSLSPQYGYGRPGPELPTTETDRAALDWVNEHVTKSLLADSHSARYLTFTRYQSGVFSTRGIDYLIPYYQWELIEPTPTPDRALFVRWGDVAAKYNGGEGCGLTLVVATQEKHQTIGILYNNGCDVLEANALWM